MSESNSRDRLSETDANASNQQIDNKSFGGTYSQTRKPNNHKDDENLDWFSVKDKQENIAESINQEPLRLDHLPEDIFHFYIFQYLDLCDIFKLKLISKKFNYLVNSYKIKELTILDQEREMTYKLIYFRNIWFSTMKSMKLRNLIISKFNLLTSNNLLNLQYLSITGFKDEYFKLNLINKFTKLQFLHLAYYPCNRISDHLLQLPDLRALYISIFLYDNKLILDTPKLRNLNLKPAHHHYSKIEFRHPESVKYLRISDYGKSVLKFINLECLELNFKDKYNFSSDDLLKFTKLKKIKFSPKYRDDILDDLLRLKGSDIELVINGVKIEKNDEIEAHKSCDNILQFQLQNYSKLEYGLDLENFMDYNRLIRYLPNHRLPSDLFKKYNNIQSLTFCGRMKDKDLLIYVIKECNGLIRLCINMYTSGKLGVGQAFYDQLPLISNLHVLEIGERNNLNYDFINKMTYLTELRVSENIFKNEIYLNDLKFLDHIFCEISSELLISIHKYGKDRYKFLKGVSFESNGNEISLRELIKHVNYYFK